MSDKHPYTPAPGHIVQVISHFRNKFPAKVTADTLRKLGFAAKNEGVILNILRFLGLIDHDGARTDVASKVFSLQDDATFSKEFGALVKKSYSAIFDLHGEAAWELGADRLIGFFRTSDQTTAIVGRLQASTFQILAAFSGHGDFPEPKGAAAKTSSTAAKKSLTKTKGKSSMTKPGASDAATVKTTSQVQNAKTGLDVGLTVRIEINLPANGDQETYDRIFKSLRENLLNG